MTIVEAIIKVLETVGKPLSHREIYDVIVNSNYYLFGAKDPVAVVRGEIRKRCYGIDFPSASPKKVFVEVTQMHRGGKPLYTLRGSKTEVNATLNKTKTDLLAEEVLHTRYLEHISNIKTRLLEKIKSSDPVFFENLVVNLLLRMGYGWDDKLAGIVTGGAGDEGIDGIINEDKLGLDKIYLQAKRYKQNKVPSNEVREFIGAMAMKGARKGVFFSTSDFSTSAQDQANKAPNMNITLVNGEHLCDLLVQSEMGIAKVQEYTVYEIDKNFFSDD